MSKKKEQTCKGHCACAEKKNKQNDAQNGKGDGPRNLSSKFRNNYDQINWPSTPKKS